MGTRSLVHVKDDRFGNDEPKTILTIYRQYDGYPTGMGEDLATILRGRRITNGISGDTERTSNGMGCLAATIVKELKEDVGNVYIYPPDSTDVGEEYVYTVSVGESGLRLKVDDVYGKRTLFDGSPDAFVGSAVEGVEA